MFYVSILCNIHAVRSPLSRAFYKLSRNDQQQGFCERSSNNLKISWHVKPYTHIRIQLTPFKYNKKNNLVLNIFRDILGVSADVVLKWKSSTFDDIFNFLFAFFSFFSASSAGLNVGSDSHPSCLKKKKQLSWTRDFGSTDLIIKC